MSASSKNLTYKVTSLLIKTIILICSSWYIIYKFNSGTRKFDFFRILEQSDKKLLLLTFFLMFLNWGLEAYKWRFLVAPLERISFPTALKSIFAGVTVSIFMPNRIGEFAGRIFFLEKADKIEATLKNFVGSMMQLAVTLLIGLAAFFMIKNEVTENELLNFFNGKLLLLIGIPVIIVFLFLLIANRYRRKFSTQGQNYLRALLGIRKRDLFVVFCISFVRYTVFVLQYYLVLLAFNVDVDIATGFMLIALTFLVTSVIPSFALTEIATRGAAAAYFFESAGAASSSVIVASLVVWIINLAIPALIGTAFIWKLKFFKQ